MENETLKLNKKELINMLEEMIKNVENLPVYAMTTPITHYDYCSLMILLLAVFKADE